MEQPKLKDLSIKKLLKEVGKYSLGDGYCVNQYDDYKELVSRIKDLNKENKRLKQELASSEFYASYLEIILNPETINGPMNPNTPLTGKPVAYFKCAKKNKPEKEGYYGVIISNGDRITFDYAYWSGEDWMRIGTVIAFTETDLGKIIKQLKK